MSPNLKNWLCLSNGSATNQTPVVKDQPEAENNPEEGISPDSFERMDLVSEDQRIETSSQLGKAKSTSPTRNSSQQGPSWILGTPNSGAEGFLQEREDHNLGFDPLNEKQEGEYPDEDEEYIRNTRKETPMEEVIMIKYDVINQRKQTKKVEKEMADFKATLEKQWQEVHDRHKEKAKHNARRKPKAPRLESTAPHYLYDSLIDRLRECTVHIVIRRAREHHFYGDHLGSEYFAKQALTYAALLDYEPLSAWCHFHIGKAQYEQKRYEEALRCFKDAKKASGFYATRSEVDDWGLKAKEAYMWQKKGESSSAETEPRMMSLEDELMGRGNSGSSNIFE